MKTVTRMTGVRNPKSISVDSNLSSGTIGSRITVSRDLEKYFRRFDFFSCYDAEITANSSILDIPLLSVVLPAAWITGADVHVSELDRTFAKSMDAVHHDYKRMYPNLPFTTRLVVDRLVDNKYASKDTALLFSGGLDSTYSLFSNIALKPRLIMIFGTSDIPISNIPFQKTLEKEYSDFAKREGLDLHFVRTNALELLDLERLESVFGKLQVKPWGYRRPECASYWEGIGYMLCHIQAAPLSIGRFGHLLVASGTTDRTTASRVTGRKYTDSEDIGRGVGSGIAWADIDIKWHGEILRHEKAFILKEFLDAHRSKLRICLESGRSRDSLNCSHCGKCLLSIATLAAAGIDPTECGFSIDRSTFNRIRRRILHTDATNVAVYWKPLQQAIPDLIGQDRYETRQFFEWFKRVDLDAVSRSHLDIDRDAIPRSISIYYWLPYPIQKICRIAWNRALTK